MNAACISDLRQHLRAAAGAADLDVAADICPADMAGDITVNCFKLARPLRRNPMQIAAEVREFLAAHGDVAAATAIKAFVNVALKPSALFRDTVADAVGLLARVDGEQAERQRYLVEFSAPNTNKPQHLGHVRNNTLGMAVCGLLRRVGHAVTPVNLVNDRGIAICKSMVAYARFGDGATPASTGRKGDHLVGDYYVRFDRELKRQLAELRAVDTSLADVGDDDLFLRTEIGRCAQEMLAAWERGDAATRALWRRMNDWVLAGFDETYARYGVHFAHTYFESDTYLAGRDIVLQGLADGVFSRTADGAVDIDLSDVKLGRKVVLRNDGTSLYTTQDLGTTVLKHRDFNPEAMIWIVGDEQIHHFKVLFAILRQLGYAWADALQHLAYGMVNLPHGKMKSREGTVVDADDLYTGMLELAAAATRERYPDVPDDLDARAKAIGLGALKFMLLKVGPRTTITFDPEAAIRFEGDTGPYVMYAYARIASLRRKAGDHELAAAADWNRLGADEERAVAVRCATYPATVRRAAADLDPSILVAHLLDLTKEFNRFYKRHSVLSATDPTLRRTRLELCRCVQAILRDGLETLGIQPLEEM